jgi:hypothetical protein
MMRFAPQKSLGWPAAIIVSGLFSLALVGLDVRFFLRPAVLLWFVVVCPGMAWVPLLNVKDVALSWTLAIAASLLIDLLLGITMVYFHLWSPLWSLIALVVMAGAGVYVNWARPGSDDPSTRLLEA